MQLTPGIVGLIFLTMGLAMLGFLRQPLRYRERTESAWFALAIAGSTLWLVALGVGYLVTSPSVRVAAWSFRLLAAATVSVSWFLLVVQITTIKGTSRRLVAVLAAYLAVVVAMLATNPFHGLVFDPTTVGGAILHADGRRWAFSQAMANYALMAIAMVLAVAASIRSSGLHRTQSIALALAALPPVVGNIVTNFELVGVGPDLTPVGLPVTAFVLSWSLYRAEFLSIVPVARQTALKEMRDAVVIVDAQNRVVDCNAVARALFGVNEDYFGQPLRTFLVIMPERAVRSLESGGSPQFELEIDSHQMFFDCATSRIATGRREAAGRVIAVRDITDRKKRERRLLEQHDALEKFANVISEDIREPLESARKQAEYAKESGDVSAMRDVLRAADRIDHRSRSLLETAQDRNQSSSHERVSVATVAAEVWDGMGGSKDNLKIRTNQKIRADPDRLQALLEALFDHATAASSGQAEIVLESVPDGFAVQISDEGGSTGNNPAGNGSDSAGDDTMTLGAWIDGISADDGLVAHPVIEDMLTGHGWSLAVKSDEGRRYEVTGIGAADEELEEARRDRAFSQYHWS